MAPSMEKSPTILVLGEEGTCLRPLVERSCNMPNHVAATASVDGEVEGFRAFLAVESLNVSVAAVCFFITG
ncbi:hypothetical protein Bca101_009499 [Brassica carinata]